MYLSRLILNPRSRRVRSELADRYQLHRTVMSAFPQTLAADERVLFRLEVQPRSGLPELLVQSTYTPDWSRLATPGKADYLAPPAPGMQNPQVKTFELHLQAGQALAFRLLANPTVKKQVEGKKNGRRVGLIEVQDQTAWLSRKLEQAGARLIQVMPGKAELVYGQKSPAEKRLAYLAVRFDGYLQVADPGCLQASVAEGIGSGKGLGFGLLSLGPA
jgi:CRISPR system Cascade subunit CasE